MYHRLEPGGKKWNPEEQKDRVPGRSKTWGENGVLWWQEGALGGEWGLQQKMGLEGKVGLQRRRRGMGEDVLSIIFINGHMLRSWLWKWG